MTIYVLLDLTGPCFTCCLGELDKPDKISLIEGACCSRMCNFKSSFLEGVEGGCCSSSKNDLVACAHCLMSSPCGSGCLGSVGSSLIARSWLELLKKFWVIGINK